MFDIRKHKESKNNLFNAYISGLKSDIKKEEEERCRHKQKDNEINFYDSYTERMKAEKLKIENEEEERYKKSEYKRARIYMYKNNKQIINIWKAMEEELSSRISTGIAEGPPKKIYIEMESEKYNVTAIITRNCPIDFTNKRDVIYVSSSYQIPKEFDEESVVKVLTELCNRSLSGQNLNCIL